MADMKQTAQQMKNLLALCLADAIHNSLYLQLGADWFSRFAEDDALQEQKFQILRNGQRSVQDLDLQALLKLLRYRDQYADLIFSSYGVYSAADPFAAQTKKRQVRALLDRLITDFRNQMEAHSRVADIQLELSNRESMQIYGYQEAITDMLKLAQLFGVVTDKTGTSYYNRMLALTQPKKRSKKPLLIAGIVAIVLAVFLLLGGVISAVALAGIFNQPATAPTTGNVLYDPDNIQFCDDEVYICSKHVYYEGNELVAVCYITNGTDKTIDIVEVEQLIFYTGKNAICAAKFPPQYDLHIAPGEYTELTFRFPAEAVHIPNADLTGNITCRFDLAFKYE